MESIKPRKIFVYLLIATVLAAIYPVKTVLFAESTKTYVAEARAMASADLYLNDVKNTRSTAQWTRKVFY